MKYRDKWITYNYKMKNSTYYRQTPVMLPWGLIVLVDKTALLNKHFSNL